MAVFNEQQYKDIQQLKKLRRKKDKTEYNDFKKALAKKWKKSVRTIELWMNKKVPGARKVRNDSGKHRSKVTPKEKRLVKELKAGGKSNNKTAKIIELKTGEKISQRKINRVLNDEDTAGDDENTQPSAFGDTLRDIFRNFFELDLIAPGFGIEIKIPDPVNPKKKIKFIVPVEDCEDICLVLANAFNRVQPGQFKVDREQLRRRMIEHLVEQQVRLAKSSVVDTKTVNALVKMQKDMSVRLEIDADIKTVEKVCKHIKPDITFTEIVSLIRQYSDVEE